MHSLLTTLLLAFSFSLLQAQQAFPILKINVTKQQYNISQPWNKNTPFKRRALGAIIDGQRILTTADLVAHSTLIELETLDNETRTTARVIVADNQANLAVLEPSDPSILNQLGHLQLAPPVPLGSKVDIWQVASNSQPLITSGTLQSTRCIASFLEGHHLLHYKIKASMQSASNSYSLPIIVNNQLLGLLSSYHSKDQILNVISPETISHFIDDVNSPPYQGFPSIGVGVVSTTEPNLRSWLGLDQQQGGVYVTALDDNGAAKKAGLKLGDVILKINQHPISQRGYYTSKLYQQTYWSHLIRGQGHVGESVELQIKRGKTIQHLTISLETPKEKLIPSDTINQAPRYLIKGGLIFQELTKTYLEAYGDNWESKVPLNLLDTFHHPQDYESTKNRIVFLSSIIPTPASTGYERLSGAIIEKVNQTPITDMSSLIEAFKSPNQDGLYIIHLDQAPYSIYLDSEMTTQVDNMLLERGLPALSR